jgi:hypothetical protein
MCPLIGTAHAGVLKAAFTLERRCLVQIACFMIEMVMLRYLDKKKSILNSNLNMYAN